MVKVLMFPEFRKRHQDDPECDMKDCHKWENLIPYSIFHYCTDHWRAIEHFLPPDLSYADHSEIYGCTVKNCGARAIQFGHQQNLCAYHLRRWYVAAQEVIGAKDHPRCHAKRCNRKRRLMLVHSRLWCPNHCVAIKQIRSKITHYHTMESYRARLQEVRLTTKMDPGHIDCINYIKQHIKEKAAMSLSNPCAIIDCYRTDTTPHRHQYWCKSHARLAHKMKQ